MRLDEFSVRFGKEILWARPELHASILAALVNAQEAHLREPTVSKAEHLRREFAAEGERTRPRVRFDAPPRRTFFG